MYDHGHELRDRGMQVERGCKVEGNKREKWDNCNSIINKIYLKKLEFEYSV